MSPIGHVQASRPALRPFERSARPVVGYAHDYEPGLHTGWHAHPRAQLLSATSGVMRVEAGRASYVIPPGTGLFLPASLPHTVRMHGAVAMRALFLHEHPRLEADGRHPVSIAISPLLREIILAACEEPVDWSLDGRGRHLAALAIDEIARASALPLSLPMPEEPRIRRVAQALLARPADPSDLAAHALAAGASVRTLSRLFLAETGMGFQQWRRQLRLTEALAALAAGRSLAEAAAIGAYASLPAFCAAFRAVFGTTPGASRAELARQARVRPTTPMESIMEETTKVTGTASAPNPKTGSSDAARGLGGHSKDASHKPGAPAEALKDGTPKTA